MQDHQHTISEVHNLADTLNTKANKDHEHAEYAPKNHQHEAYAPANHKHNCYAAEQHTHPELQEAIAQVRRSQQCCYAAEQHTHPELQEAIAQVGRSQQCCFVLQEESQMDIDGLEVGKAQQVICTNTEKIVRLYDYFKSAKPIRYNTQNIVLAPGKTFAATICRGKDVSYVLFNGVIV